MILKPGDLITVYEKNGSIYNSMSHDAYFQCFSCMTDCSGGPLTYVIYIDTEGYLGTCKIEEVNIEVKNFDRHLCNFE